MCESLSKPDTVADRVEHVGDHLTAVPVLAVLVLVLVMASDLYPIDLRRRRLRVTRVDRTMMDLIIETSAADKIPPERWAVLEAMYQREFGWDRLTYAAPQWYVMGIVGDRLIGRVAMLERVISVDGASLRVGGITGVVTEPDFRGQGVATRLVGYAVGFLRDELKIPLALLTCNRKIGPFYERLGWRVVRGPTVYTQPGGACTCPGLTMVVESGSARWPDGLIDMRGLPW
jgi:GNAT superfamily N-acetyltransferase